MNAITEKTETLLKELVVINNDRFEGYKNAADETKDDDLKALFNRYSSQSRQFAEHLKQYISPDETPKQDDTRLTGKLYRVWMDVKAAITNNNRKSILSSCEFGEDIALKTYRDVMEDDDAKNISPELYAIIEQQHAELNEAHHYINALRDNAH